jgi:transposase
MTVSITRDDLTSEELRQRAGRTKDAAAARRMLALALVLEGWSRAEAAKQCGMDRQTLRDWVHRYNAAGLSGLCNRAHGGGAMPRLSAEQQAQLAEWVTAGPDLAKDGVVRWRLVDLQAKIATTFKVHLHERSIGKLVHRLGFSRVSVRPRHPQADLAEQEGHKKTLLHWSPRPFRTRRAPSRSNCGGRTKLASASRAA